MRLFFLPILASSLFLCPAYASIGGVDGGGGKSVVCRDAAGKITSAEILDLYEGRAQYGYQYKESAAPMTDQAKAVVSNLAAGRGRNFQDELQTYVDFVNATKRILPDGTSLLPVDDAANVIVPTSCKIEQLANFTIQNQILLNGEIWSALSETNKAALLVHEALYKVLREFGATTSLRARKAASAAFSGVVTEAPYPLPKAHYECYSVPNADGSRLPGSHFYAYNDETGQLNFQIDYLDGELMLTNTDVSLDQIPLKELRAWTLPEMTYGVAAFSKLDFQTPVVVSFLRKGNSSRSPIVMKIGFGSVPAIGDREFTCNL